MICKVCGKEFKQIYGNERLCSSRCRYESLQQSKKKSYQKHKPEAKQPEEKRCAFCGKPFKPYRPNALYCSAKCYSKAKWRKERQAKKPVQLQMTLKKELPKIYEGDCVVCGKHFTTMNPAQKTCSKQCAKRWEYSRKQRRIPKDRIIDKDITLEALYRRDSGVCYLCGKLCDWNDRDKETNTVGALYPTIDHLIPLAHGGTHAWKNIRLAHFACNVNKSDALLPDLDGLIPENALEFKREIRSNRKKQVSQYTKEGEWVATYESTAEAERKTGIKQKGIQNCARREVKSYGGFVWRYAPYLPPIGV